jgi:TRAP-type mannitol/chloroaromatic compound transport system permease small subunit
MNSGFQNKNEYKMNTKKVIATLLVLITIVSCAHTEQKKHIPLVNKNASEKAQKLYNFIQDIGGKYTLAGQHEYCGKGSVYNDRHYLGVRF